MSPAPEPIQGALAAGFAPGPGDRTFARQERLSRSAWEACDAVDGRINLAVSLIRYDDGRPRFTVAMVEDITDRFELQERLRFQALHDPLTGLPNRTLCGRRGSDGHRFCRDIPLWPGHRREHRRCGRAGPARARVLVWALVGGVLGLVGFFVIPVVGLAVG